VSEPEPVPQPAISIAVTQWPPKEGQVPAVQGERQQSTVLTLAPPEEEREPIPETRQHAGDRRRRAEPAHRYVGLGLLVAAGLVALVAGLVWGSVTGGNSARTSAPRPTAAPSTQPPSTQPATAQPSLLPQPLLDQYRATGLVVAPGSGSTLISWQAPQRTDHVALFVIIAELNSRPVTQQEVGVGGRSVAFTGLLPRQDYCFVVATIVEQDSGAAAMAVTQPVCAVSRTGNG
jgi:hypothetical protein